MMVEVNGVAMLHVVLFICHYSLTPFSPSYFKPYARFITTAWRFDNNKTWVIIYTISIVWTIVLIFVDDDDNSLNNGK